MDLRRLAPALREPVDAASLGFFRIVFGVIMLVEVGRFFAHGWINDHYLGSRLLFKYYGFDWISPWPYDGLYLHFAGMGLFAAMVALGLRYRFAIVGLFLAFAYVFLLDQASYLNQYYLALCIALILCFLPAERAFSLDARLARASISPVVPRWSVLALRLQFEVMLLHAGLVKLNGDWLRGEPLGLWLSEHADRAIVGPWLVLPGVSLVAAYGVILLHLLGAPLLLFRRTRFAVFVLYVGFHLTSSILFRIGMFSWLTLAGTLIFFEPDWPRAIWRRLNGGADHALPVSERGDSPRPIPAATVVLLTAFFIFQMLVPLRYLLYPGNVAWTREGEMFSWRMKLNDSRGSARFIVTDPGSGTRWDVDPSDHLRPRSSALMATDPDMILQFAHYLQRVWAEREGIPDVQVRAVVMCSLNGRTPAPLIDPERDLIRISRTWKHQNWILPLRTP
jgi:vitamin K-dependent gamma-carboxylase